VQPAHLERHQARVAEVEAALEPPLLEVPEVDAAPVAALLHVGRVEAGLVRVGLAELAGDQRVLARLVPEVVVQRGVRAAVLPAALELERGGVEDGEAARPVAVGVAEHADDDVAARHAVDGVRPRVARLGDQLVALDDGLHARAARVVRHLEHVDARGAEAGHDQVRAVRAVAGGAAAVPAEVVQLVADVRHRCLMDDLAALGVDDGDEVRRLDPGALMQAGEVEERLGRRVERLGGGGVERRWHGSLLRAWRRAPRCSGRRRCGRRRRRAPT
jgi:hypothetical protein